MIQQLWTEALINLLLLITNELKEKWFKEVNWIKF
jgi:hypothetical protein